MVQKGIFVTMDNEDSIKSCLKNGVYGQLMKPEQTLKQNYCRILADYFGARPDDHIFFFTNRTIYYGGQVQQADGQSTVFFNSGHTPLDAEKEIEYIPEIYSEEMDKNGMKEDTNRYDEEVLNHQPFLFSFEDTQGLQGENIKSDTFYNELQQLFSFPLPSTEISGRAFCLLTPGETDLLLQKISNSSRESLDTKTNSTELTQPLSFDVFPTIQEQQKSEAQVEASLMASPEHLPVRVDEDTVVLRQVPSSASRPNVDQVDIALYDRDNMTFPTHLIELKNTTAGKSDAEQVDQYLTWADSVEGYSNPELWVFAPSIAKTFTSYISQENAKNLHIKEFKQATTELLRNY